MADPASILGTAVGVTSLSIQACQALSQYYTHFQSFDDDIGAIVKRLDGLSQSLEVLEWLRPKVEVQGDPVSSQLQQAVEACTLGLSDLQEMAAKCGELAVPTTFQDKKRIFKKRLLWPFRQETVASMVGTLDGLQANVQLAVQLLNIEAGHRSHQSLETSNNALVAKVEQVQQNQFKALATIQEGFIELHKGHLSDHTATILLHDSRQLSSQIANIEKKMDVMMAIRSNSRKQVYTPNHTVHNSNTSSDCTCRRKRYTQRLWAGFGGLFEVEVTKETEHSPSCSFLRFGSIALVCQADCRFLKRLLNIEIKAGISYIQTSGLYTIQPTLTVKPIVSDDSPAFSPIYTLRKILGCACEGSVWRIYCPWCGSTTRAPSDLQRALDEIVQSFRSGLASPHATTEKGVSVLDLAYDLALNMVSAGHLDGQTALILLEEFVNEGRFRQYSALARVEFGFETAFFPIRKPEILDDAVSVYSHRLSIADTWLHNDYEYGVTSTLKHKLLQSEENLAKYDCDCTLYIALHRRSEKALHEAISVHDRGLCEHDSICNDNYGLLLAAWHWPDGLRILLRASFLRARGPLLGLHGLGSLDGIVSCALSETKLESLHILGEAHPMAYWVTFLNISESLRCKENLDWAETFIRDMRERINTGRMTTILGTPYKGDVSAFPSFHHAPELSVDSMRLLLDAGITYDDEPKHAWGGWGYSYHFGTPLWLHGFQSVAMKDWYSRDWELLELMVIHGARLDWQHPELLTTPAHLISLNLTLGSYYMKNPSSSFLRQVLSRKHLDCCTCACSKDGCLTVACAGSSLTHALTHPRATYDRWCKMLSRQFSILCDVVQADPSTRDQFALAVLRVHAFDELGLTHTCCRRFVGQEDAWTFGIHILEQDPEDLAAFRYSERKDLEALEDLMIKTEHAWADFSGTFLDFLRLVWLPLMRSRDHEFLAESVSHVAQRLSEVGVDMYMPVGTSTWEAETEEDETEFESAEDDLEDKTKWYDPWDSPWNHMRPLERIEFLLDLMAKEHSGHNISEEQILPTDLPNRTKDFASQDTRPQDTRSPRHEIEPLRNRHTLAGNEPNTPRRRQSI